MRGVLHSRGTLYSQSLTGNSKGVKLSGAGSNDCVSKKPESLRQPHPGPFKLQAAKAEKREILQVWTNDNGVAQSTANRRAEGPKSGPSSSGQQQTSKKPEVGKLYSMVLMIKRTGETSIKSFVEQGDRRARLKKKHQAELILQHAKSGKTDVLRARADDVEKLAAMLNDLLEQAELENVEIIPSGFTIESKGIGVMIPSGLCGQILGAGGKLLKSYAESSGAYMKLQPRSMSQKGKQGEYGETRMLEIGFDSRESGIDALQQIFRRLSRHEYFGVEIKPEAHNPVEAEPPKDAQSPVEAQPSAKVGSPA